MKKTGRKNKTYSPEFKIHVIMDMRNNQLGYRETMRKYFPHLNESSYEFVMKWERIYLEEGAEGLMKERRGRACKASGTRKGRPPKLDKKVKEDLIAELRQRYPLKDLLELSGIARSTYYYYLKQKDKDKYESEKEDILEIYNGNKGRYGYRRICAAMKAKGYTINHKTVLKLMKALNLRGKQSKNGKYHSYKGEVGKVADNLLHRDFYADKPFEKLTTDVTEFKVGDEKVYLSPVLDMFNREIVSYSISTSPNLQQIRDMLSGLFEKLPADARPLFHSDQGWQYQHSEYQRLLAEHNITQSMSRKGNCMDNGIMENFFGRLKVEMYYGEKFESPRGFIEKLEEYIHYYNNERISMKLKGMSPVQYRTHSQSI